MTFNAKYPPSPPRSENADEHEKDGSLDLDSKIPLPPFSNSLTEVLDIDAKTPDFHVARDPRLIRLTGVHPFNVEAPLSALFDQGTEAHRTRETRRELTFGRIPHIPRALLCSKSWRRSSS